MGCNCGGQRAGVKYLVTYADKTTEKVDDIGTAQQKVRGLAGATFRAVVA